MTEMEIGGSGGRLPDDEDLSRDGQTSGCGAQASGRQLSGDVSDVKSVNGAGPRRASEGEQRRMVDITRDKPIKVTVRVVVPVRDHPKFNFVGKLLGPKGNSLKRLQEDTMTKMAILGRGSMRDKHKEEELRCSGDPKFSHLSDDLHVEITAFAPPAEAHARIAYALAEVRRFLVPDYNDEIRQEQMWEMQILNTAQRRPLLSGGGGGDCTGGSPASSESTGSLSPATPPPGQHSPPPPLVHPALRGLEPGVARGSAIVAVVPAPTSVVAAASATVAASVSAAAVSSAGAGGATPPLVGRKRPLLPGGARPAMSPTKRTVLSILARARAAQGKDLPEYLHSTNGRSSGIPVLREDAMPGGSLV